MLLPISLAQVVQLLTEGRGHDAQGNIVCSSLTNVAVVSLC